MVDAMKIEEIDKRVKQFMDDAFSGGCKLVSDMGICRIFSNYTGLDFAVKESSESHVVLVSEGEYKDISVRVDITGARLEFNGISEDVIASRYPIGG